jgi:MerR family transcriptional regulator, heat shock protein HspR
MKPPDRDQGVFMISVAAQLAGMHQQTLRMYEQRGLITPKRSPKGTRLYSLEDVERLRRIQQLTNEMGMNLAGVEKVFEMEATIERMGRRIEQLERRVALMQREMEEQVESVRRTYRAEIVRWQPPETALIPVRVTRRSR